ncbi:MAG: LamG-like jellyroll fold domain-containing protein [Verrucomicrobiota bacterium]
MSSTPVPVGVAVDSSGNVYIADSGNVAIDELPYAFVDTTAKTEPASGGSDSLPTVLPATANLNVPGLFAPTSQSPSWLKIIGVYNGVVSFGFTPNQTGSSRTGSLTVLGASVQVSQDSESAPVFGATCQAPPSGVVNWWTGDGTLTDIVGGDNAIVEGGVTFTSGIAVAGQTPSGQQAFQFDGSTGYLTTSDQPISNPQNFTLECWFNTASPQGGVLIGFAGNQTGPAGSYDRFIYMDNNGYLHFGVNNGNVFTADSTSWYNDGNWHHVAATLSSTGGASLYVDGALEGYNSQTTAQNYNGWWRIGEDDIGGWPYQPSSPFFAGAIAQVSIYSRPLSPTEIEAIYLAGSAGKCPPAGILGTYTRLEGSGASSDSVVLAATSPSIYWTATANDPWLYFNNNILEQNEFGEGSVNVVFSCSPNPDPAPRVGTLTIGGLTVTVTQTGTAYAQAAGPVTPLFPSSTSPINWVSSPFTPNGVAVDSDGNVYTADSRNAEIDQWGAPSGPAGAIQGFVTPVGAAADRHGNVYIIDSGTGQIDEWMAPSGPTVAIPGLVFPVGLAVVAHDHPPHPSPGPPAQLVTPVGLAVDGQGNLYIADSGIPGSGNQAVYEWTATGGLIPLVTPSSLFSPPGFNPSAFIPVGVAVDAAGNVYIADSGNGAVEEWTPGTPPVLAVLVQPASTSGGLLNTPTGVAVDGAGNVYISDSGTGSGNGAIYEWTAATGGAASLIPSSTFSAPTAFTPSGVAVDGAGNVYMADTVNQVVEELPYAFVNTTSITEPANGGSDSLPGVLPATANLSLSGPFAPAFISTGSETLSLNFTGTAGGVVSFDFSQNLSLTGSQLTGQIMVLGDSIAVTQLSAASSGVYFGNPLNSFGGPDGIAPLVILDEFDAAGPLASSPVPLPDGMITYLKFYGGNYNFNLYVLRPLGSVAGHNTQKFQVVSSTPFFSESVSSPGLQNLLVSPCIPVSAGDILAFAGIGPYYVGADEAYQTDATYEDSANPNSYSAAAPSAGSIFTVGVNTDPSATYEYIDNAWPWTSQSRTYAIGVDVVETGVTLPPTPAVNWPTPAAAITYGTALSAQQLNATANIAGTFSYTPSLGTVLQADQTVGSLYQTLSVTFTPTDSADYPSPVTANVPITVNPAMLTIIANSAEMAAGGTLPALTATYQGFVNGDTASSLSTAPTFSLSPYPPNTSVNTSVQGPVTINVSGAADLNYSINYVPGTLSVRSSLLTTSIPPATAAPGATSPPVTVPATSVQGGVTATVYHGSSSTLPLTVLAGAYASNPEPGPGFGLGTTYLDLAVPGATTGDSMTAMFSYPYVTPAPTLMYYDAIHNVWETVKSDSSPPDPATPPVPVYEDGYWQYAVVFDDSSTPTIEQLTGTVFALATPAPASLNQVWNGGSAATMNWSDNANWVSGTAPLLTGDSVEFAASGTTDLTPNMDMNYSVSGVTFDSTAGILTIGTTDASMLTLYGTGVTNNSPNEQTLNVPITLSASQIFFNTVSANLIVGGAIGDGGAGFGLTKTGPDTLMLTAANTYTGATTISAGTLALTGGGSIATTSGVSIASAGTLDVSGVASPYTVPGASFTASGDQPATIIGASGGTVSLASLPMTLNLTSVGGAAPLPALTISQGALALVNNAFTVNTASGLPLPPGTYLVVQTSSPISGGGGISLAGGTALGWPGTTPSVAVSGDDVILAIGYECSYTDTGKSYSQLDTYDVQLNFSNILGGLDTVVGYNMINCAFGSATATAYGVAIPVAVAPNTEGSDAGAPTILPLGTTNLVLVATAPPGGATIPGGGTARVNAAVSDSCGNLISFDPIIAGIYLSRSGEIREVFHGLSRNDKYVSLNNGAPGLRSARILVNGAVFANLWLVNGESEVLDISGALTASGDNTVVVEGFGLKGDGADVSIGEMPGEATGLALAAAVPEGGTFINLPTPRITPHGNQVVISWPATGPLGEDFTQYQLLVSPTGQPDTWSLEGTAAVTNLGQLSVTVPAGGTARFYQLENTNPGQ